MIKKFRKNIIIIIIIYIIFGNIMYTSEIFSNDLLENAFRPSMASDSLIDLGNNKNAVGNEVFREGIRVDTSGILAGIKTCFKDNQEIEMHELICKEMGGTRHNDRLLPDKCLTIIGGEEKRQRASQTLMEAECTKIGGERKRLNISSKPPLIVTIAKFLLRITIALSITMVIFHGIKYIIEAGKGEEKSQETIKSLIFVGVGIVLALLSLTIVNLLGSITLTTIPQIPSIQNQTDTNDGEEGGGGGGGGGGTNNNTENDFIQKDNNEGDYQVE